MATLPAVLDASFWINAERAGLVPFLGRYFQLHAPPRVVDEVLAPIARGLTPFSSRASVLFATWREQGHIHVEAPATPLGRFDPGENEAIALARERGWLLLIDDESPRHYSRGALGLRVVDSPAFTVLLYDHDHLSYMEAVAALHQNRAARRLVREALIDLEYLARQKEKGGRR